MQKLNILTTMTHEGYQYNLAKTGHSFYSIKTPERPNGWKKEERNIPTNWFEIELLPKDVKFHDVLIINNPQQREFAKKLVDNFGKLPIVEVFHCFPYIKWGSDTVSFLRRNSIADACVFATTQSANMWLYNDLVDSDAFILGHTANEDIFKNNYVGNSDRIISIAYDFKERDELLGYSECMQIVNGFNHIHIGNESFATKSSAAGLANKYLPESRVFLNTSHYSPIPTSLLEAMRVGIPVLSVKTNTNEEIFDYDNRFLYNDILDAKQKLSSIINDNSLAKEMSKVVTDIYNKKFSTDRFVNGWNNLLRKVMHIE